MESKYFNFHVFEIKLYHYKDMADLHYKLLNIFSLICYNSDYCCFCDKYQGFEKDYHIGRDLCLLCHIKIYFCHDLMNFEEYLDQNQFNLLKLKAYGIELYPFLIECYHLDKRSLETFSRHYVWPCHNRYTGQKSELTLKEIVKENIKLKKRSGEESIPSFFIKVVTSLISILVYQKFS